jgi:hypothetical protein
MEIQIGKTIPIELEWVRKAYRKVRQGGKASGVDGQSWTDFEKEAEKESVRNMEQTILRKLSPATVKRGRDTEERREEKEVGYSHTARQNSAGSSKGIYGGADR